MTQNKILLLLLLGKHQKPDDLLRTLTASVSRRLHLLVKDVGERDGSHYTECLFRRCTVHVNVSQCADVCVPNYDSDCRPSRYCSSHSALT